MSYADSKASHSQKIAYDLAKKRCENNPIIDQFQSKNKEKLFIDGNEDYIFQNIEEFWKILKEFIEYQESYGSDYDLSFIVFPSDPREKLRNIFSSGRDVYMTHCIFNTSTNLSDIKFNGELHINNAIFRSNVNFSFSSFKKTAYFSNVSFRHDTTFSHANFQNSIIFENTECKGIFDFSDVSFENLSLDKSNLPHASYLRLYGWNSNLHDDIGLEQLSSKHFQTKETARIIKAHFEKQNNILESNLYYPIEMDKYRREIVEYYSSPIKAFFTDQDYFTITINKYISNYNTSWFRVLAWIIGFTLLIYLLHEGIPQNLNLLINMPHRAIELVDPLKMFKGDDKLYEGKELWGFLARITILYLFWQFIVAFRQNTRRK